MNGYYLEEGFPFSSKKLDKLKDFLRTANLTYDNLITYSVNLCNISGEILASGSRHRNILKCLAVSDTCQGNGYLNLILTKLLTNAYTEGYFHLFLFTKPKYTSIFENLGFYSILTTEKIQFMENTPDGISHYLQTESQFCTPPSKNQIVGSVVINANPFTLGHLYLLEEACKHCDCLHVFVLSEETRPFSALERITLVRKGCAHLPRVYVHGGSEYLISYATFPDYFMKDKDTAPAANGKLDLLLFCHYFKEAFHISRRFAGEEPFCPVTQMYNQQMLEILPTYGIDVCVFPRFTVSGTPVSATKVRKYFGEGNLSALAPLVPETTYSYLKKRLSAPGAADLLL